MRAKHIAPIAGLCKLYICFEINELVELPQNSWKWPNRNFRFGHFQEFCDNASSPPPYTLPSNPYLSFTNDKCDKISSFSPQSGIFKLLKSKCQNSLNRLILCLLFISACVLLLLFCCLTSTVNSYGHVGMVR